MKIVGQEKNDMLEEARRIITTIRQMEASLAGNRNRHSYQPDDEDLKISYPLIACLQRLKEKHQSVSRVHRERFEQVQSESSHLIFRVSSY